MDHPTYPPSVIVSLGPVAFLTGRDERSRDLRIRLHALRPSGRDDGVEGFRVRDNRIFRSCFTSPIKRYR